MSQAYCGKELYAKISRLLREKAELELYSKVLEDSFNSDSYVVVTITTSERFADGKEFNLTLPGRCVSLLALVEETKSRLAKINLELDEMGML